MTSKVPLFVELCAGLASVSLMLQGGKYARPPVSRMGNKHGYGLALLRIMGLRPGQGAERYLWCEPDPGCRALLHAYTDREVMQEAARIIRGWASEEPRSLWERLRAEGPIRVGEAREVAVWGALQGGAAYSAIPTHNGVKWVQRDGGLVLDPNRYGARGLWPLNVSSGLNAASTLPATVTPDARAVEPREVAREILTTAWSTNGKTGRGAGYRGEGGNTGDFGGPLLRASSMPARAEAVPETPATVTPDARAVDPREVARWAQVVASNRLINISGDTLRNTGAGGSTFASVESGFGTPADVTAQRFEDRAQTMPATVTDDARAVEPREVARWSLVRAWGRGSGCELTARAYWGPGHVPPSKSPGWVPSLTLRGLEQRMERAALPARVTLDARPIEPADLPPGTVVYMDPPYRNTTGYGNDLPRSEVVALARRWAEAGARVYISEAEPIAALIADGWHEVEITSQRIGQKRTFSKQQREFVTCSHPPAWKPAEQADLFGC